MRIAILGATGHISKCALWAYSINPENEFYLYSRNKDKLEQMANGLTGLKYHLIEGYNSFAQHKYDVIVNGTGFWDNPDSNPMDVFFLTEKFDNMIIQYQIDNPKSISIHISSGAAYHNDYQVPVDDNTCSLININKVTKGEYYSTAKINSEIKHRAYSNLNIVDLRLFGFFSRYMSLEYNYLLSAMIRSVKEKSIFTCTGPNFWRDYIHLEDFRTLLEGISCTSHINLGIDIRSAKPISRDELIAFFQKEYGLSVKWNDDASLLSKTGSKPYYYSTRKNPIYEPQYSSLDSIKAELEFFLGGM